MASKQLGKLRQWAGEVISSREKTALSEEFQELERDIELRRSGNERLYFACDAYHHALKKKKDCLALDDPEKLLPIDILGIVMITHGEECGESTLGTSLVKLGRAHCKVATLQEGYALTFRDTYMASIEKFGDEIKEYDQMRKKLDSRRLSYDAAVSKAEKMKTSKKDKDRKDAEDELEKAQARYEETMDEVRAHMNHIQAYEIDQMRELTALLDVELDFVDKYAEVLREVKKEWPSISSVRPATRTNGILKSKEKEKGRRLSGKRAVSSTRSTGHSTAVESADEDDDDETRSAVSRPSSRRSSIAHHRSDSFSTNKSRSRPSSRASRKRADSIADQEKSEKGSSRISMAGLMGSLSGRGKKKFSNLDDEEESVRGDMRNEDGGDMTASPVQSHKSYGSSKAGGRPRTHSKSKSEQLSGSTPGTGSPGFLSKLQAQLKDKDKDRERVRDWDRDNEREKEKKMVRALHDFSGSSDELSFKTGDEIVVVNEVLDGWWMGELRGRRGLFPVPYTEPMPSKPPLPIRPDLVGGHSGSSTGTKSKSKGSLSDSDDGGYRSSEVEDSEVYGSRPLALDHSPFFGGSGSLPDSASFRSSLAEDDREPIDAPFLRPSLSHSSRDTSGIGTPSNTSITSSASSSPHVPYAPYNKQETTPKKVPPPPPPRRSTGNLLPAATPPIPPRRPGPSRAQSSSGSLPQFASSTASVSSHEGGGYDVSPFDSATELSGTTKKNSPF